MDEADDAAVLALILFTNVFATYWMAIRRRRPRPRRFWMRNWFLRRDTQNRGLLHAVETEMRLEDEQYYRTFLRMGDEEFTMILNNIFDDIAKEDTNMRCSISARKRLALTLRYLATGETFESLSISCRISATTIGRIVKETLLAIKERMEPIYLQPPSTPQEWERIAGEFYTRWDFPNCIGALDGKHIGFRPSKQDGAFYHNYKGFESIVLLALVGPDKKFLTVDIGANGRANDGGVFAHSKLKKALTTNKFNFPENKALPGRRRKVPHVIVTDNAFPLSPKSLKPYVAHGLTKNQIKFNRRLSRARNVVENSFGILANRFRVFLAPINHTDPEFATLVTHTCCVLHNFLLTVTPKTYEGMREDDVDVLPSLEEIESSWDSGTGVRLEFLRYVCDS